MGLPLRVVLDDWAQLPEPGPFQIQPVSSGWGRSWQLDAMIAASIARPGPLVLVTGI